MVIFVSRSEKKALETTRRILDQYAVRIGTDTWQTIITEAGLKTVKTVLRRHATKNMAVSCHWIRSRKCSELVWIVGSREKFNEEGVAPIATTEKNLVHGEWENAWQYLSLIKDITALAALFHDWGKASDLFQEKLENRSYEADPYRHEWISCKLLEAVVLCDHSNIEDTPWLTKLAKGEFEEKDVLDTVCHSNSDTLQELPPLASLLAWLIMSHHRMPDKDPSGYRNVERNTFYDTLSHINAQWGYEDTEASEERRNLCFTFSHGLLWNTATLWKKNVKKWCGKMLQDYRKLQDLMQDKNSAGAFRPIAIYSRLALMLSDHYTSSLPKSSDQRTWKNCPLWANTDGKERKQYLEEHLVGVMAQALKIVQQLPKLSGQMEKAHDIKALEKKSPNAFSWQDKVVEKIKNEKARNHSDKAFFIVNMASTGCGKTFANAKIMRAISDKEDTLRYILALGLRSLTLQTGDEYRQRIGLDETELAVLIGSSAILELHNQDSEIRGSESAQEPLLQEELDYIDTANSSQQEFLNLFFNGSSVRQAEKNKAFLYKPILVTTIDHMMGATETTRGGRYLLPSLRLMSSDLVIDEIDDFDKRDLIAISRLVHLAGMFGRNVVISSATIPPDLAEGMYRAYRSGLSCANHFFAEKKSCDVILCDEFGAELKELTEDTMDREYQNLHEHFIKKRVEKLKKIPAKRKASIVPCGPQAANRKEFQDKDLKVKYFQAIRDSIITLHRNNHIRDKQSDKNVSFGVVRMANINPCVELSLFLLQCQWPEDIAVRVMTYHSRQILLMRHEQEKYLDKILKRKNQDSEEVDIQDPVIRKHLCHISCPNVIFIMVATPVEEVGRDHDLDWAVVEPSSYRSVIQLAGRILRHRNFQPEHDNMAVLQFNLRGMKGEKHAFIWPGYETEHHVLESHDMKVILDEKILKNCIDAVPRVLKKNPLQATYSLIDLEHAVMEEFNSKTEKGPQGLNGWVYEYWWLTALPVRCNPFRGPKNKDVKLCMRYSDGKISLSEQDGDSYVCCGETYGIQDFAGLTKEMQNRLWLVRDYQKALSDQVSDENRDNEEKQMQCASEKYGELVLPHADQLQDWLYSDQFGLFQLK